MEPEPEAFPYQGYPAAPLEGKSGRSACVSAHLCVSPPSASPLSSDQSQLLFAEYEGGGEEPVSAAVWRNCYLMDYDPLNQLLVCMVCGELQYSHSVEGARAHIDDAHPETLSMEPGEQRRILEAWDEQVSRRERFFTSQLQQHSGALAGTL